LRGSGFLQVQRRRVSVPTDDQAPGPRGLGAGERGESARAAGRSAMESEVGRRRLRT
jgi:hypothetical protein